MLNWTNSSWIKLNFQVQNLLEVINKVLCRTNIYGWISTAITNKDDTTTRNFLETPKRSDDKQMEWPILVLYGNGDVYVTTIDLKTKWVTFYFLNCILMPFICSYVGLRLLWKALFPYLVPMMATDKIPVPFCACRAHHQLCVLPLRMESCTTPLCWRVRKIFSTRFVCCYINFYYLAKV